MTAQPRTPSERSREVDWLMAQGWTAHSALDHIDGVCDPYSCTHPQHAAPTDQVSACCNAPLAARAADPRSAWFAVVYCPSCARALTLVAAR